ncbi:MAG: hypothetical protein ACRCTD_04470 [Beijerinckiaceae bacterium]
MSDATDHHSPLPEHSFLWRINRTRILRDATDLFLKRGPCDAEAVYQYAELAAGLLSRIDRNEAVAIARVLATIQNLPETVLRPFADLGIEVNHPADSFPIDAYHSNIGRMPEDQVVNMSENILSTNGPTFQVKKYTSMRMLSNLHDRDVSYSAGMSGLDYLAVMRACERRDKYDFVFLAGKILCNHQFNASTEQLSFILKEGCGEALVMITIAIGGDRTLLAKVLDSFIDVGDNKLKSIQRALQFYETINQVTALRVLSDFFSAPQITKALAVQHVTVQSGQSVNLSLRNSTQLSKNSSSIRLSERLIRSFR